MSTILEARDLKKHFRSAAACPEARRSCVRWTACSFAVQTGETLAIVGESGCGKSTVGRLVAAADGADLRLGRVRGPATSPHGRSGLRGLRRDMQMVFQDPFSSLNPRMTLGDIVGEPLWLHGLGSAKERRERTAELLRIVGLRPEHAQRYPHEFSGGQRQRIGIARALASPRLIIGDEPVSALDVSIQAQVINLLEDLKERFSLTLVIIAHDLAVIRHMSDRVIVMYLGKIVEVAPTAALYGEPLHPYTRALLAAIPLPSPGLRGERKLLEGDIPSPANPPSGCRFHTRCPFAQARCKEEEPLLRDAGGREVACHFYEVLPRDDAARAIAIPDSAAKQKRLKLYRDYRGRQEANAAQPASGAKVASARPGRPPV